jgi:hypothetical protein
LSTLCLNPIFGQYYKYSYAYEQEFDLLSPIALDRFYSVGTRSSRFHGWFALSNGQIRPFDITAFGSFYDLRRLYFDQE